MILECIGAQDTISQAVGNARKGSTIVVVGVFGKKPEVDLGLVQDRDLILIGSLMYQKRDYERPIELVATGKLSLDAVVTHRFQFKDYLASVRDKGRRDLLLLIWAAKPPKSTTKFFYPILSLFKCLRDD